MKKINLILKINKRIWLTVLIALGLFIVIGAVTENAKINTDISKFKQKGVYQEAFSTDYTKFFIVPRETSKTSDDSFYISDNQTLLPGRSGDILTDRQSNFDKIPFVHEAITTLVGGHAVIIGSDYTDNNISSSEGTFIESTGLAEDGNNTSQISSSGIRDISGGRKTTVGYRVKTSKENRIKASINALSMVGNTYNYSFLFETKRNDYCTDLVKKAYLPLGINLDYDRGVTSVQDISVSSHVFIFYYKFTTNKNVTHIYYLDDINNKQDISKAMY